MKTGFVAFGSLSGALRRISELEAERQQIHALVFNKQGESHAELMKELAAWDRHCEANLRNSEENALLRRALEDAPHIDGCRSALVVCSICSEVKPMHEGSMRFCPGKDDASTWEPKNRSCDCWKAALARIPEARK